MTGLTLNRPSKTRIYKGNWNERRDYPKPKEVYRLDILASRETQNRLMAYKEGPFDRLDPNPKYPFAHIGSYGDSGEMTIYVDASIGVTKATEFMEELLRFPGVNLARWC